MFYIPCNSSIHFLSNRVTMVRQDNSIVLSDQRIIDCHTINQALVIHHSNIQDRARSEGRDEGYIYSVRICSQETSDSPLPFFHLSYRLYRPIPSFLHSDHPSLSSACPYCLYHISVRTSLSMCLWCTQGFGRQRQCRHRVCEVAEQHVP